MNASYGTGVGQAAVAAVRITEEVLVQQRAIAATRQLEDELTGSDLRPELEDADVDEDIDDQLLDGIPTEESEPGDLGELAREDLSGQPADRHEADAAVEPPEREDYGDSEQWFGGEPENPFEQDRTGPLPLLAELPRSARPVVRFAIDADYSVHPLDVGNDAYSGVRRVLASAVARHLRFHGVLLKEPGDWCQIPAIGSDDQMLRLVAGEEDQRQIDELIRLRMTIRKKESTTLEEDSSRLDNPLAKFSPEFRDFYEKLGKRGANLKAMGLLLANGDVVKVSALMDVARARPIVRYAIDVDYTIHPLDVGDDAYSRSRSLLASAVARHLRLHRVPLNEPDACDRIPAIGGDDQILRLVAADEEQERIESLIQLHMAVRKKSSKKKNEDKKRLDELLTTLPPEVRDFCVKFRKPGANLETMGLRLANGDVLKVADLMGTPRKIQDASSTRAAALRLEDSAPPTVAGEHWSTADWQTFKRSQQKKKEPRHRR